MTLELERNTPTWRKVALSSWRQSNDPAITGWIDIDATELGAYLSELRDATGARVTVTHLVGKAVALAFAENRECNAVASLGRLKRRSGIDVFFSVVARDGKNLSGTKLRDVDRLSLEEIAAGLGKDVGQIRTAGDTPLQKSQASLGRVPAIALRTLLELSAFCTFDLDLKLEALGVPSDPFGTAIVSNIGVFGIEQGFAPLIPAGRTAALFSIGAIRPKPIAVGSEVLVRPVLTICGTFDHRVVDGYHLGRISSRLKDVLEQPARHLGRPASTRSSLHHTANAEEQPLM